MMTTPSLIQWHEGMFLSPQHFQQLQRRYEGMLSHHTTSLHPYSWGITDMGFDQLSLSDGILRIAHIKALMPDHTVVNYPEESSRSTLQIDLKTYKKEAEAKSLKVYFSVPEFMEGQSPVIGEWPRYDSVEGGAVGDENIQDNVIEIPRLHPKFSLIIAETYPARYSSFPVAEVKYTDEGFHLMDFIPPLLHIAPQTPLHDRAVDIVQRLREKAQYLCDKWQRQMGTVLVSETAGQLRPMMKVLPLLEAQLHGRTIHPVEFFDLFAFTLGELSTMRLSQVPSLLPSYNHDNLRDCLNPLMSMVENLLEHVEQSVIVKPFNQRDRLFYLKMHESYLKYEMFIGARGSSSMNEEELFEWMRDAIIASDSVVEQARLNRVTGVPRKLLNADERADFLTGRGMLVFRLKKQEDFMKVGENLNIFNVSDDETKRPSAIVLYLTKNQREDV